MVAGCLVFRGLLPNELPKPGQSATIRVQEWLYGDLPAPESVEIQYDDPKSPAVDAYTARAWSSVKLASNTLITVVLARGHVWFVQGGRPAIVTSSDHDGEAIRSLLAPALRLEKHPDSASDEVASLSGAPRPVLAGFLFAYLVWSNTLKGEMAADLLDQIFANPYVPPEVWDSMPFWLEMASAAQPPEKRAALTRRYLELAQRPDPHAARAGFAGLALVISDEESTPLISPELRIRLANLYLGWIQKNGVPRNDSLERALGVG
jgi:hypothetical protein